MLEIPSHPDNSVIQTYIAAATFFFSEQQAASHKFPSGMFNVHVRSFSVPAPLQTAVVIGMLICV